MFVFLALLPVLPCLLCLLCLSAVSVLLSPSELTLCRVRFASSIPQVIPIGVKSGRSESCHLTDPLAGDKHCKHRKHTPTAYLSLHSVYSFLFLFPFFAFLPGYTGGWCTPSHMLSSLLNLILVVQLDRHPPLPAYLT